MGHVRCILLQCDGTLALIDFAEAVRERDQSGQQQPEREPDTQHDLPSEPANTAPSLASAVDRKGSESLINEVKEQRANPGVQIPLCLERSRKKKRRIWREHDL